MKIVDCRVDSYDCMVTYNVHVLIILPIIIQFHFFLYGLIDFIKKQKARLHCKNSIVKITVIQDVIILDRIFDYNWYKYVIMQS